MCNPIAAAVLVAAAAASSAIGQAQAAKAAKEQAKYNKRVAENAALHARRAGDIEEQFHRQKVSGLIGRQRAAIGASGISAGEGSAGELIVDQIVIGEHEALMIRNNTTARVMGYETQAAGFQFEKELASIQGTWGVGATLAGGAASAIGAHKQAG